MRPRNAATVIIAAGAAAALLFYGRMFFITLIIAIIIAFILDPFVGLLMRLKLPRAVASFVVCALALLILYMVGLGFYTQFADLYGKLPAYSQRIEELVDSVSVSVESMERSTYKLLVPKRMQRQEQAAEAPPPPPVTKRQARRRAAETPAPVTPPAIQEVRILPDRSPVVDYLYAHLALVYQVLLMASFVPFLVYFMLSWRDHIHRSFLQLFEGQDRLVAGNSLEGIASMVRAFVVGNFVLGMVLASASSLLFWIFRLPYPLLIGPLSGFVSLVPYIGLPLAMLPPLFGALTVYKAAAGYLLIGTTVAVLHLLALNLFYPKLVGSRVHLNPLVVTVALMIWGVLWGTAGLILAIPLTAGIKAVCDNVASLQPYGRLLGD